MGDRIETVDESWRRADRLFGNGRVTPGKPRITDFSRGNSTILNVGIASTVAFGLLAQVNKYAEGLKHIEEVSRGVGTQDALRQIAKQLAPDQRVMVFVDKETGEILSVQPPGRANFSDPDFELVGDNDGKCHLKESVTQVFRIKGKDGSERILELDDEQWGMRRTEDEERRTRSEDVDWGEVKVNKP